MTDDFNKEKRKHSSRFVPYSYYRCESLYNMIFGYVPAHWHEEFEINYIVNGSAMFKCGEKDFIASKGDIVFFSPNILHAVYPHKDCDQAYDTLVFSVELFGVSSNDRASVTYLIPLINSTNCINAHITPQHPYYNEIRTSVENIFSCAKSNDAILDLPLKSELIKVLWLLYENKNIQKNTNDKAQNDDCIKKAILYIEDHFREDISVSQVSDTVHLSKSYFMNSFKRKIGMPVMSYIIQHRINAACEELCMENIPITQIATACGFNNISNFNRQFKKVVGCSPKEYRALIKNKE